MTRRPVIALVCGALVLGVGAAPALAKHKKPITKTYTVTAYPFPATATIDSGCWAGVEGVHKNTTAFTVPEAGALQVVASDFMLDWDLFLFDAKSGKQLAVSNGDQGAAKESVSYRKGKKGQVLNIVTCNWSGGPTATVKYTFTFAK